MIPPPLWADFVASAATTIAMRRNLGQIIGVGLNQLNGVEGNRIWPSAKAMALAWPKEVVG